MNPAQPRFTPSMVVIIGVGKRYENIGVYKDHKNSILVAEPFGKQFIYPFGQVPAATMSNTHRRRKPTRTTSF
ncbi:MAG: hypothetical protein ACRDPW_07320 [Mycobacteriales bacterium]